MTNLRKHLVCLLAFVTSVPLAIAQGTYTQIDVPGALFTQCYDINTNGDIVGFYATNDGEYRAYGFILSQGTYTRIAYPGATWTKPIGINDVGQVVGIANVPPNGLGFLYDAKTRSFTNIEYPGADYVAPLAINGNGTIVGSAGFNTIYLGYEQNASGRQRTITMAGASATYATGVSASGVIVGYAIGEHGTVRNFLARGHKWRRLSIPNAPGAYVSGTNPAGTAFVGSYYVTANSRSGFLYQNKTLQTLQFPGKDDTYAEGVNAAGKVSGTFFDTNDNSHCFIWTPPADAAKQ